ncbi:hypothetical protein [Micromonospora echinaurantiaca]
MTVAIAPAYGLAVAIRRWLSGGVQRLPDARHRWRNPDRHANT